MALPDFASGVSTSSASRAAISPPDPAAANGINSPELTTKGSGPKAKQRSITDIAHVFMIISALEESRKIQNEKNGRIQAKINSERPYSDEELKAEGLGYKSNFSTKPLATTIGKVASRLTKAVQSARYLTSAELPDTIQDAKQKTEFFRSEFTALVRSWDGWYDFVNEVATEDSTFGWTTVTWFDTVSWKPTHFRQDKAFFPDGTKHNVDSVQFAAFQQDVFPHELAEFIRNYSAAKTAGWNIENTVDAINTARPQTAVGAGGASSPYTDYRRYEDAMRESSVSSTLANGAKQIRLWHVIATEIDGKVSHYIGDGNSKKLLFEKEDRFPKISDCLALLSYEQGNGLLMGSKGIGREIYEIANVVDRSRNEVVDRLQLSGKILMQAAANQISRFKLTVIGNCALVPEGFTVLDQKIESNVEEFMQLDGLMTQLLDQLAGGVTPKTFERERVTKAEVDLFAEREEEKRDDITTRFIVKLAGVISTIQRRICSKETIDEDAKAFREKMLATMSEKEISILANRPALQTIEDFTQSEAQLLVSFAASKRQDPLYNHKELEKRATSALVSAEFAEAVILPDNDPTEQAEQVREQMIENTLIEQGIPVPVSPRDNHLIHIDIVKKAAEPVAQSAGQGDPKAIKVLEMYAHHWSDHLEAAEQGGAPKQIVAELTKELAEVGKHIGELQAQAAAKQQQDQINGLPVAPVGTPAPDAVPPGPPQQ